MNTCAAFACAQWATVVESWSTEAGTTCYRYWCAEHAPRAALDEEENK